MTSPLRLIIATTVLFLGAACSASNRDHDLEKRVVNLLQEKKKDASADLSLQPYLQRTPSRMCIQGTYVEQDRFENLTGEKVQRFQYLNGQAYGLWMFYRDGAQAWILIPRTVMDFHPTLGKPCTDVGETAKLALARDGNLKKFYLPENTSAD